MIDVASYHRPFKKSKSAVVELLVLFRVEGGVCLRNVE
jgi:hypothetical protein